MKAKKNSTSGPEKIRGRRVPLTLKLGAILMVLFLLGGGLWAWFFSHKIEKSIFSATTQLIDASEEKIADVMLEQIDVAQKILLVAADNSNEELQDKLADIPIDLYRGDETKIKAAIIARTEEHKEHMLNNMLTLQGGLRGNTRKVLGNHSRELKNIQQETFEAFGGQVRNGLLLLGFTNMILLGLIVVASVNFLILRRIAKLRKGARQIAEGNYGVQLDSTGFNDEIYELTDSFNLMAMNLKKQENAVIDHTSSLEEEIRCRKLSEKALCESEERFRSVAETANDAIVSCDAVGTCIYWNKVAAQMFIYSSVEMIGEPITTIMPEGFRQSHKQGLHRLVSSGKGKLIGKTVEITGLRKDHSEIPIELSLSTWKWKGSDYFTAIIRDISERKETEEAVKKERDTAQRYLDLAGVMFVAIDTKGKVILINPKGCDVLGYDQEDILGKDWFDNFLPERLRDEIKSASRKLLAGEIEAVEYFENPVLTKAGEERSIAWHNIIMRDGTGKITGHLCSGEDITKRKKAEESLKHAFEKEHQLTEELSTKNVALMEMHEELKIAQSRMLHREKMASVGQLAAGVAHEINNPVGFIASNLGTLAKYVDLMTEFINAQQKAIRDESAEELKELRKKLKVDYITEDAKDLVKESLDGTDRVSEIVQGLKSFSRVDEVEHKPADINECLESTINMVWNELKYLATVTKEYGDLPLIKCYPRQLNQVFMNLLINAAHAIEKQGEISIKTWHQDDSIFVSIADTGQGVPADNLNKLFDPFFTTKDVGKGTGLGLSIAHGIIQKHHGEINVQSEVGKGSTFTIMLPAV